MAAEDREQGAREAHHIALGIDDREMARASLHSPIAHGRESLRPGVEEGTREALPAYRLARTGTEHRILHARERASQGLAGEESGHGQPVVAMAAEAAGLAQARAASGQIVGSDRRAELGEIGEQLAGDIAAIEILGPRLGQSREAVGQPRQREKNAASSRIRPRGQSIRQEDRGGYRKALELAGVRGDDETGVPVDLEPLSGQSDGRCQQVPPRQPAEATMQQPEASDIGWHGDGEGAAQIAVFDDPGPGKQVRWRLSRKGIGGRIEIPRGAGSEVEGEGPPRGRLEQEGAAHAPRTAHPWLGDAQGKGRGDRGIERVAAGVENVQGDPAGLAVLRRHCAPLAARGRFAQLDGSEGGRRDRGHDAPPTSTG